MTKFSWEALKEFLIEYQSEFFDDMRVADYGGTDAVGNGLVKMLLDSGELNNYHMLDFDNGVDLREPIKGDKFDLGICMDLLEHTSNPFLVAKNITDSLKPGALLFVTVPFVWEIHAFPDDFWRFTPHGLGQLFPEMTPIKVFEAVDPHEEHGVDPTNQIPVAFPWIRTIGYFQKKYE